MRQGQSACQMRTRVVWARNRVLTNLSIKVIKQVKIYQTDTCRLSSQIFKLAFGVQSSDNFQIHSVLISIFVFFLRLFILLILSVCTFNVVHVNENYRTLTMELEYSCYNLIMAHYFILQNQCQKNKSVIQFKRILMGVKLK